VAEENQEAMVEEAVVLELEEMEEKQEVVTPPLLPLKPKASVPLWATTPLTMVSEVLPKRQRNHMKS
jgi:hypothetical protein